MRYVCYSTANVEQNFAVFIRAMGDRLNSAASNGYENRHVKLMLTKLTLVLPKKAQRLYMECGCIHRGA